MIYVTELQSFTQVIENTLHPSIDVRTNRCRTEEQLMNYANKLIVSVPQKIRVLIRTVYIVQSWSIPVRNIFFICFCL